MRIAASSLEVHECPHARCPIASILGAPKLLERRRLEQKVEDLQRLPERVTGLETQILQLRSELGVEFSAIRERFDEVLAQLREGDEESRRFARTLHEEVLTRMQTGDETTQSQMRVLHEDVINRFALLQEGLPAPRRKRE